LQPLDLYGEIQEHLHFEEEIEALYKAILLEVIQKEPQTLIDIGCGQGEFCNLAKHNGITTIGVDLSNTQIELAKKKFPELQFQAIDIANIDKIYDCATATFDVINYIPQEALKAFFQASYNLLEKGGYFIFDINSHYGFEEIAQGALIIDQDDIFIGIDANFEEDILFTDMTLFKKAGTHYTKHQGTIKQFYHPLQKLQTILNDCKFEIEKTKEFSLHSEDEHDKIIVICKKQ
jgi:cyclopropane fatty-acyl-phospholipid synthase-like methyltransferase